MNVDHKCTNCGSNNIRVRTSEKIGLLVIDVIAYCNNCGTELKVTSQITRVRTPTYHERPEALRVSKPLKQIDERQLEIATD
ncbi:hypothetical protein BKG91_03825 [Rodentibacter caecimuris]|uniref:Uncharacterized protein n=1 Tax=Rodentibacter caecimuris TaxID=1796644 RepID=A0AAJ3K3A6_9PAST|nr:hypothetical protein [Rodentibacter heylii]OOF70574.1 hypothetical protein BKG90_09805 [Rodentibacter heylii]OOF75255.1 hypothetical protein BKG91_03825 [Rodentibacter heylii]OOF77189.1 hypothetical protein BKG99_03985 [Rodentibacter heylii]